MTRTKRKRIGRGLTVANVVFDEFAFMKYNSLTFPACVPAWKKASENAAKHNTPYGITVITTPANLDNDAGKYCYEMIEKAARWNIKMFDMTDDDLNEFIESNSENNYIFVQYTYKELGRDEKWLREMVRQCNGDLAKVKREILLEWPRSMDSSVFNEEQLDKIYAFIKQPVSHLFIMNKRFVVDLYETPDMNKNYILSCDVAGGLSHDNSVINIIDPEDFRIVGDFRNNKIDVTDLTALIKELMTLYFRNALLVIERNSYRTGHFTIMHERPTNRTKNV